MISPTSQFKAEHIFDRISVLTFSSFDNRDIVVVLKMCIRDSYDGEKAVKDTAYEVRWARNQGIFVIGIFVGNEEELSVEKRIYGKDFAYIRNISNFSRIVGTFLRRQIDME